MKLSGGGASCLKCTISVFATQRRVISLSMVKSDGGVGDGHVGVEGAKASLVRPRDGDSCIWVHVGFEGKLDAL